MLVFCLRQPTPQAPSCDQPPPRAPCPPLSRCRGSSMRRVPGDPYRPVDATLNRCEHRRTMFPMHSSISYSIADRHVQSSSRARTKKREHRVNAALDLPAAAINHCRMKFLLLPTVARSAEAALVDDSAQTNSRAPERTRRHAVAKNAKRTQRSTLAAHRTVHTRTRARKRNCTNESAFPFANNHLGCHATIVLGARSAEAGPGRSCRRRSRHALGEAPGGDGRCRGGCPAAEAT